MQQLRLTPILFELGARPHPPRALYRSYLAQSDVFVGIYWERYGWIAPDMEISGLEDELVLSDGMPRLVYVKRPAPGMEPRLADMLERLETEGRASYKPFSDSDELRRLLVDDLALLLTERFDGAASTAPTEGPARIGLPAPISSFLGREGELAELQDILRDGGERLVTLTGPGGTGKTRLALEAVRRLEPQHGDIAFVDLSAERRPDDVFTALGRTLDVRVADGVTPLEALKAALRERRVLLVLDNFEQVTAAGAGVAELLEQCPGVRALVTTREPLRIGGEHVILVPPMSVPDPGSALRIDAKVLQSEAGRLFTERAAALGTGFELTAENAADVAAICRRLDGLPLAIELAAAQVRLFSVEELRARLESRVEVLRGGPRDLPARQQTLRNTIEWSSALLTDHERLVFQQVAVFIDARLSDIESTLTDLAADAGVDVVEALSALVDKNLVRIRPGAGGRPRLSMLNTIREFALEQLDAHPEIAAATREAHAAHYTSLAVELHRSVTLERRAAVLGRLEEELPNLRAAWNHWVEAGDVARLDDLLGPAWGYHEARGDYRAIISLGEDLLRVLGTLPESPERRHDELTLHTNLARTQLAVHGFTPQAERTMRAALERSQQVGEDHHRFATVRSLASLRLMRYELEETTAAARELMEIARRHDDPAMLSEAHLLTGVSASWSEDLTVALGHLDEAVTCFERTRSGYVEFRVGPNPGVVAHTVSGLLRWSEGRPDAARRHLAGAVGLARDLDHPYSVAYALHHATLLDLWRHDLAAVVQRAQESLDLCEVYDYPVWRALATILHGTATVGSGQPDAGLAEVEQGFAMYRELQTPPVFWPQLMMVRANAYGMAGHVDRALELMVDAAASLAPQDPLVGELALAHGDLILAATDPDLDEATALFERAASIAAARGARMNELMALTRLARVHRDGDRADEVRDRLRALYATFTEGFDSHPLTSARAVLDG